MTNLSKNRLNSAWTPLVNNEANDKIFNDRIGLIYKWYDKWTDAQRKQFMMGLLSHGKYPQLVHARTILRAKCPTTEQDFTRVLPRCLSLYILSFLDPRSLCRASQVCWYWKILSEDDQLWLPKCSRVGWYLPFAPTPFENGTWKRLYMENVKKIRVYKLKKSGDDKPMFRRVNTKTDRAVSPLVRPHSSMSAASVPANIHRRHSDHGSADDYRPPWRATDPKPQDIRRFNYLNNDDIAVSYQQHSRRPGTATQHRRRWKRDAMTVMAASKLGSSLGDLTLTGSKVTSLSTGAGAAGGSSRAVSRGSSSRVSTKPPSPSTLTSAGSTTAAPSSTNAHAAPAAAGTSTHDESQFQHAITYDMEAGELAAVSGCVRPNWASRPQVRGNSQGNMNTVSEMQRRPSPIPRQTKKVNNSIAGNASHNVKHEYSRDDGSGSTDQNMHNSIVIEEATIIGEIAEDDEEEEMFRSNPWRQMSHVSDDSD